MPLGIVSNRDFELERANSDSTHEVHNGQTIDFDESVNDESTDVTKDDSKDEVDLECKNKESIKSNETSAALIPEIVTSDMIPGKRVGRHESVTNVPQSLRKIIAEESIEHGNKSAKNLLSNLGVTLSDPTISTYKSGNISPSNGASVSDNDLLEYINTRKSKLGKKALNKLSLALTHIDEAKLSGLEARDLSAVAKDMAIIVDKMQPTKRDEEKVAPVQFVIMAPQINNESHYQTVTAKDNY